MTATEIAACHCTCRTDPLRGTVWNEKCPVHPTNPYAEHTVPAAPMRRLEWVVVDQDGRPLARFLYREHATDWMDAMRHHDKHWRLEQRP